MRQSTSSTRWPSMPRRPRKTTRSPCSLVESRTIESCPSKFVRTTALSSSAMQVTSKNCAGIRRQALCHRHARQLGLSHMGEGRGWRRNRRLIESAHAAPRCTAKSKRSGVTCRAPAVKGKRVCRMHGAKAGAPRGPAHGRYVHGRQTQQAKNARKEIRDLIRMARQLAALF